jgi:hypothetical protein
MDVGLTEIVTVGLTGTVGTGCATGTTGLEFTVIVADANALTPAELAHVIV